MQSAIETTVESACGDRCLGGRYRGLGQGLSKRAGVAVDCRRIAVGEC
jgi:hypothetical protein